MGSLLRSTLAAAALLLASLPAVTSFRIPAGENVPANSRRATYTNRPFAPVRRVRVHITYPYFRSNSLR